MDKEEIMKYELENNIEERIVNTTGKMAILLLSQLPYLCRRENKTNH